MGLIAVKKNICSTPVDSNKLTQFGKKMKVRKITREDIPALMAMNERQIQESKYHALKMDKKKVKIWYLNFINNPQSVTFILEDDNGTLMGAMAARCNQFYWNYENYVTDFFFYVIPEYRKGLASKKLYDALYQWAVEKRAIEIQLSYVYGEDPEKLHNFLLFLGYKKNGENYRKAVI